MDSGHTGSVKHQSWYSPSLSSGGGQRCRWLRHGDCRWGAAYPGPALLDGEPVSVCCVCFEGGRLVEQAASVTALLPARVPLGSFVWCVQLLGSLLLQGAQELLSRVHVVAG